MGTEFRYGLMVRSIKECGKMAKQQEKVNSCMLMVMFMTVSGRKTKHVVMVFIFTTMERNMKANGSRTISMDMEFKSGLMVVVTKECINKVKNMEKENTAGEIVVITMVIGSRTRLLDSGNMFGLMEGSMLVSG